VIYETAVICSSPIATGALVGLASPN